MSLERSGLVDLRRLTKGMPPTKRPTITATSIRKLPQEQEIPLQKSHFNPALHPYLYQSGWTTIKPMDLGGRGIEFLRALHALPLEGKAIDSFLTGEVFDFHGATLEDFVKTMDVRGGRVSVIVKHDHIDRITVGVAMPAGNRSVAWSFHFEAQEFRCGWVLELRGVDSSIGPVVDSPEPQSPAIQNRLLPGG